MPLPIQYPEGSTRKLEASRTPEANRASVFIAGTEVPRNAIGTRPTRYKHMQSEPVRVYPYLAKAVVRLPFLQKAANIGKIY